jgi:hypothetical protein
MQDDIGEGHGNRKNIGAPAVLLPVSMLEYNLLWTMAQPFQACYMTVLKSRADADEMRAFGIGRSRQLVAGTTAQSKMPVFDQNHRRGGRRPQPVPAHVHQTLAALGYQHKQSSPAGGALVYPVTCLIAHCMRSNRSSVAEFA